MDCSHFTRRVQSAVRVWVPLALAAAPAASLALAPALPALPALAHYLPRTLARRVSAMPLYLTCHGLPGPRQQPELVRLKRVMRGLPTRVQGLTFVHFSACLEDFVWDTLGGFMGVQSRKRLRLS